MKTDTVLSYVLGISVQGLYPYAQRELGIPGSHPGGARSLPSEDRARRQPGERA